MFRHACALGLEGIVSKHRDAPYRSGRCPDWIKVRTPTRRQRRASWNGEAVVHDDGYKNQVSESRKREIAEQFRIECECANPVDKRKCAELVGARFSVTADEVLAWAEKYDDDQ
jgi:hypothetical protein